MRIDHHATRLSLMVPSFLLGAALSCAAPVLLAISQPPQSGRQSPPVIASLRIHDGEIPVPEERELLRLNVVLAGARPTEYRISGRPDMVNALWMPLTDPIQLRGWQALISTQSCSGGAGSGAGRGRRLQLFLQVRAPLGTAVKVVGGQRTSIVQHAESNIISDAVCVR